jgi:hypothetical protein
VISVAHLDAALQTVLTTTAATAARASGFVQRRSKLTGPLFVQTLVYGWLAQPQATLVELCQGAATLGVAITPQGLAQRFTEAAARCLEPVLQAATTQVLAADPVALPLLQRFTAVLAQDSTTIVLPAALAGVWAGCGGSTAASAPAALKLQVQLDVRHGTVHGPLLQAGRTQDHSSPHQHAPLPRGALRLADLGYWSLPVFAALERQGAYWLARLHSQTVVQEPDGPRWDLLARLQAQATTTAEYAVQLGVAERLPARLLVVRVPQEVADQRRRRLRDDHRGQTVSAHRLALAAWTLLVTNVPPDQLTLPEALVLARVRWQIELLFKLWKQHGLVDEWRSEQPWRILCEVYAKLVAVLIQHWCLLRTWHRADRSLIAAARTVRAHAPLLTLAQAGHLPLAQVLAWLDHAFTHGARLQRRRQRPSTYQLLADPDRLDFVLA